MGYYTYYTLEDIKDRDTHISVMDVLLPDIQGLMKFLTYTREKANIIGWNSHADEKHGLCTRWWELQQLFTNQDMDMKWYNEQEDMKNFSWRYPNCIFIIHGNGEESGDNWNAAYCDGEVNLVYMQMPELDLSQFERKPDGPTRKN